MNETNTYKPGGVETCAKRMFSHSISGLIELGRKMKKAVRSFVYVSPRRRGLQGSAHVHGGRGDPSASYARS